MKGHRWFAASYDFINQWGEARLLGPLRQMLLADATGRVLEIGVGTGANIGYYAPAARVIATEPDPFMLPRAKRRATALGRPVPLVQCRAEALPFSSGAFDNVVSTLVLCTVVDPSAALSEIRRVLKPSGRLRFIEHVRFGGLRGRLQDAVTPMWRFLGAGCHPNRRTAESLGAAGFRITQLQRQDTPLLPIIAGRAAS